MEALENLVKSDAFFPVILALLVVLLVLFCYFIISNKKRENLKRNRQEQPMAIQEEIKLLEEKEVEPTKVETPPVELPLVDIPIPKMDDTEVMIEETESVTEKQEEAVEIPVVMEPIKEGPVDASEIVNIEAAVPLDKASDVGEKVEIPNVTESYEETPEEQVIIEESGPVVENNVNPNDLVEIGIELPGMKEQAFDGVPAPTTSINENIVYEEPKEYTGEKTEIFDFPDFSEVTGADDTKKNINVDEEIIKTANEYIASIMSK